jgi:hypothetical protein
MEIGAPYFANISIRKLPPFAPRQPIRLAGEQVRIESHRKSGDR